MAEVELGLVCSFEAADLDVGVVPVAVYFRCLVGVATGPDPSIEAVVTGGARECGPRLKVTYSSEIYKREEEEKPLHVPRNWVQLCARGRGIFI
jgi:hypothetical protein